MKYDIGIIGLAVMGRNLVLNFLDHGYSVAVYNRTVSVTEAFVSEYDQACPGLKGTEDMVGFVRLLQRPRKVLLMVKAGAAVDAVLEGLLPLLEPGDIVMDGGNTLYSDTERRLSTASERGVLYVGLGISGGEEGARRGPSLMPGGERKAWETLKPMLQAVSVKVPEPCCDWIGPGGSGHFVKMIHNGIEYGDIQLICESWDIMHRGLGMSPGEAAEVYRRWNTGSLESYLVEITADILAYRDEDGVFLITKILDTAGQKGTGKWGVIESLNLGVPAPLMGEAVCSRFLSALKDEREAASAALPGPVMRIDADRESFLSDLEHALLAAKILSYAQGFAVLKKASDDYAWNLDLGMIASLWRGGCIIRSGFLDRIRAGFDGDDGVKNLVMIPYFRDLLSAGQDSWRRVVARSVLAGIPVPAIASALTFYDGYRSAELPAGLLQAQRDYFGGHRYERKDRPRGSFFHTNWRNP